MMGNDAVNRTPVNPWPWSLNFGFNQAEIIEGASRQLVCSGQTSVDAEGKPQHAADMRSQMTPALDNLEAVVNAADMERKVLNLHNSQLFRPRTSEDGITEALAGC